MTSQTMKAMVLRDFGGPEMMELQQVPVPILRPGHVLVQVAASSVNPVDTKIRRGMLAAICPEPRILGCDVAGTVVAAGEGAAFQPGDKVWGCAGGVKGYPGALAEYMLADSALLARVPEGLSMTDAAALPLVTITAWEGLMDRAKILPGQRVLIHAGCGGVGHVAIQIAKAAGCDVWTTVSTPEKADLARGLGADGVIFYRDKSVADYVASATGGKGFDVVLDTVGGDNVARCFEAAAISGTVVSISTRTTADLSPLHAKGLSLHVVFMLLPMLTGNGRARQGDILREAGDLIAKGKLRPLTDGDPFPFTDAPAAHARLESGEATGKVVLAGW